MKIAAVIVTFNRKELLKTVVQSVMENKVSHIYIIDNNSSDGTEKEMLKYIESISAQGLITFYKMNENTGGAGGFYQGVKLACESDNYDWLWLMDDDINPEKNTLSAYKKFIRKSPEEVGAVMGQRSYNGVPFLLESKSHNFKSVTKNMHIMLTEKDLEDERVEISDFPFEGPLINVNVIKKIGYPEPEFFIIGDDTDYAIRINKVAKSYMVVEAKFNRLLPLYNNVDGYDFNWKSYYTVRNVIHLNIKYGETRFVKYGRGIKILLANLKSNFAYTIKSRKCDKLLKQKYIWLAFYHGITGKLGKTYVPGDF